MHLPLLPGLLVLFAFYGIRGYATPLLKDMVNTYCVSETRATVLSIRSLLIRVSFALLGPFIGSISAGYNLAVALQVSGLILMVLALFAGLFLFLSLGKEIACKYGENN